MILQPNMPRKRSAITTVFRTVIEPRMTKDLLKRRSITYTSLVKRKAQSSVLNAIRLNIITQFQTILPHTLTGNFERLRVVRCIFLGVFQATFCVDRSIKNACYT